MRHSGSREDFFKRGLRSADLKELGNEPDNSDVLMTVLMWGRRVSRQWVKKEAGRGSISQVLIPDFLTMFLIVASVTGSKDVSGRPEKDCS